MNVLKYILVGIYALNCLGVIILAMIQTKEDGGASSAIMGGSSGGNFYEKNKGKTREGKMKKWTIILGSTFAILSIVVSILYMA